MALPSDTKLLEQFEKNINEFLSTADLQRREIIRSHGYMAGYSFPDGAASRERSRPRQDISLVAPLVNAIAGSDIMKERDLEAVPIDEAYNADADIADDLIDYAKGASDWKIARGMSVTNTAICGVGAHVTYLDMTSREHASGKPITTDIYPGFLFWDISVRNKDINKYSNFCGYADPMRSDMLEEYVKEKVGDEVQSYNSGYFTDQFMAHMRQTTARVDMLYHYFWREYAPVWTVANPFIPDEEGEITPLAEIAASDDIAVEFLGEFSKQANVDITAPYWTLDKDEKRELDKTIDAIKALYPDMEDLDYDAEKRKVWVYYRAEIALGLVLSKSKSFSQNNFPLIFRTGYFDNVAGIYYGFVRPLSKVQDNFNDSLDDLMEYSADAASGGQAYISGAKDEIERIIKHKLLQKKLTPLPDGATVTPKGVGGASAVMAQVSDMLLGLFSRSIGLGQEFFGVITSGSMTDSLYGKVMKQAYAVLEQWANNFEAADKAQAQLDLDIMIAMARAEPGKILPILSPGREGEQYIRLEKQNIARNYVLRMEPRPFTDDEKQQALRVTTEMLPIAQQAGVPLAPIFGVIVNSLPVDQKTKDKMLAALQPAPPQEPDPRNLATIDANIRLINAQAGDLELNTAEKQATLEKLAAEKQSIIDKNNASATKSLQDAAQ